MGGAQAAAGGIPTWFVPLILFLFTVIVGLVGVIYRSNARAVEKLDAKIDAIRHEKESAHHALRSDIHALQLAQMACFKRDEISSFKDDIRREFTGPLQRLERAVDEQRHDRRETWERLDRALKKLEAV